jgi:hypothetical protein
VISVHLSSRRVPVFCLNLTKILLHEQMLVKTPNVKSQGIADVGGKRQGCYEANSRFSCTSASNNGDTIRLQRQSRLELGSLSTFRRGTAVRGAWRVQIRGSVCCTAILHTFILGSYYPIDAVYYIYVVS